MRVLKEDEILHVSGGGFDIQQVASDIWDFLISEQNPLNGANIGRAIGSFFANIGFSLGNIIVSWFDK
ncbi:hypothetical protein PMPD1_4343 [Paramixta manurensis]|uniref:Uncharacterized protein n=2 Tax=Paramixta manurensis TaxID=2740817 RepID=A0A6M8UQT9_9GAMM|nr:hypothetical protein PMPD1_4343 [Erwiniaceae bacterium PD-1]